MIHRKAQSAPGRFNKLRLGFSFLFFCQFVFLQAAVGFVGNGVFHPVCL
jgi:hypothetical protein